jgi:hypothetical protein
VWKDDLKAAYLNRKVIFRLIWLPSAWMVSVYRHDMTRPDNDAHLHNHPWQALSFIVRGGYWEQTKWGSIFHHANSFNRIPRSSYHRIASILPGTRTYLLSWGEVRQWGYLVNDRHVDAPDYKAHLKMLEARNGSEKR